MRHVMMIAALLCCAALAGGCATTMSGRVAETMGIPTGFLNKTMEIDGQPRGYVVYVPRDYDPGKAWPLIVFLHGAGERGDDGLIQSEVGIGTVIRRRVKEFPAVVVMPQCPEGGWWDKAVPHIDEAIKVTLADYTIDSSRVYLTGLSMGGFATWMYGAHHADQFAALMPICGGGDVKDAAALAKTPIWAFHGADDGVVPPKESTDMVEAVKKAGGSIQYTEFEKTGHNSWDKAYGDPKAIKWMFKQKK